MQSDGQNIIKEVMLLQKNELVNRLVSFVLSDTILFLPEFDKSRKFVEDANMILNTSFVVCCGIDILSDNIKQQNNVEAYLNGLSMDDIARIYLLATELRSVLLGILLVRKKITVDEAFDCAFFEEIQEQKKWGMLPEISLRHQQVLEKLRSLCEAYDA